MTKPTPPPPPSPRPAMTEAKRNAARRALCQLTMWQGVAPCGSEYLEVRRRAYRWHELR